MTSVAVFLLAACANAPEAINTVERFSSRVDDAGDTLFAYGIAWKNSQLEPSFTHRPPPSVRRQGRDNTAESADRRNDHSNDRRFAQRPDKKTKLELEDKAALGLRNKLENQRLCAMGHVIDQVIWENGRIRLMGSCL
ncbi:MAG: hypothetical protein ACI965_002299 [Paraglaciecola sp.]|jgi:hypothetical protein